MFKKIVSVLLFLGGFYSLIWGLDNLRVDTQGARACVLDYKCDDKNCDPDPVSTYTAAPGYLICQVIIKAGSEQSGGGPFVFTEDECQNGYCVSGIGTDEATAQRICDEGPECHAISNVEYWINQAPPPVQTSTVTKTATVTNTGTVTVTSTKTHTPTPTAPVPSKEPSITPTTKIPPATAVLPSRTPTPPGTPNTPPPPSGGEG